MDSVTSVHVSEKFCHPRDFVTQSLECARSGVQRDGSARRSVHKTSDAVHDLMGNRRFIFDSRGRLPETWRSWSRDDSANVNVEFEDELQGCKKPMSRDLTGLRTLENSAVAGYSGAAVVDDRRVASSTIELPRCEVVELQKSAEVSVTPLYCPCIVGRGREAPQPLHLGGDENATFEETDAAQDEDPWEYDIAPRKGLVPHAVRDVYASLQELSYQRMILKWWRDVDHCRGDNCPRKRDSREPEFPNPVDFLYKSCR